MQFRPRFLGSTAAFALGILAMIAGVVEPESSMLLVGLVLTVGSLAYRSAKRTRLDLARRSTTRTTFELIGLATLIAATMLQTGFWGLIYTHPIPNLAIPLWTLIAYGVVKRT